MHVAFMLYKNIRDHDISGLDSNSPKRTKKVPEKDFAADFRAEKSQEGLHRKRNDRHCPIKLGPRILKIVVFEARRRLLHPHFWLGSNLDGVNRCTLASLG